MRAHSPACESRDRPGATLFGIVNDSGCHPERFNLPVEICDGFTTPRPDYLFLIRVEVGIIVTLVLHLAIFMAWRVQSRAGMTKSNHDFHMHKTDRQVGVQEALVEDIVEVCRGHYFRAILASGQKRL